MSEKLTPSPERIEKVETQPSAESHNHKEQGSSERGSEDKRQEIENIKHKVEAEAKGKEEVTVDKAAPKTDHHFVTKELKDEALKRSLQRVRKQLPAADKTLSKVIHRPAVDLVSKVGEKTIARPTGVLTGAIVALAGSSYVLYSAKHYGFTYNYWIIFALFVGGYIVGLLIDLLVFTIKQLRRAK